VTGDTSWPQGPVTQGAEERDGRTVRIGELRVKALADFLADWEAEHGVLTADEIARAERELGLATGESIV
jgi:hypothetical protein